MLLHTTLVGLILPACQALALAPSPTASCPHHWQDASLEGLGCLLFNSITQYSWDGANNFCQAQPNATLIKLTSEDQMRFIQNQLTFLADHEGPRSWWTSGTDAGRNGQWHWASSLEPVGSYVWQDLYPSGATDNCLFLNSDYGFEGENYNCLVMDRFYPICQIYHHA